MKRFKHHLPIIVLLTSLAAVFALRYSVVIQHLDMGADIAGYLATMNTVFGDDPGGLGLLRPPLIALPLKLFTLAFGTLTGAKVFGVLVSVAIGVPFYLLARRICHPWIAVAMSIMFVLSTPYANMLGWGYITMIGIFFILLTLHFFLLVLEKPSKRNVILTGVCASLLVGFHQLSLAFFVSLSVIFIIALLLFNRERLLKNYKPVVATIAIGGILSTPYIPTYLNMLRMQSIESASLSISTMPLTRIETHLGISIWPAGISGIILALALAVIALVWLWHQDRNRVLLLAAMLLFPLALMTFILPPPFIELNRRAHYFLCIPVWLIVGIILSRLWSWQKPSLSRLLQQLPKVATIALIAALLPSGIILSQRELGSAVDFFNYLDEDRWEAVQWIGQNTEPGATIAVYPTSLGWWIGAEAKRNTFLLAERDTVVLTIDYERSLVTDRILSRNQGLENGNLRLAMTYPYDNASGNPVLSVYVGGFYKDVLMFDNRENYFEVEGSDNISFADASKETIIKVDDELGQAVIPYQMGDVELTQTVTLRRGEKEATVGYKIDCNNANVTKFDIPIFFSRQPTSVSNEANEYSFEVTQELNTPHDGIVSVITTVTIETDGATLDKMELLEQGVISSFNNAENEATIYFHFNITGPQLTGNAPVSYYIVPGLIKDYDVNYVVLDLRPPYSVFNEVPEGTEEWLNNSPYYKLVYSQGDVRIYRVCSDEVTL